MQVNMAMINTFIETFTPAELVIIIYVLATVIAIETAIILTIILTRMGFR